MVSELIRPKKRRENSLGRSEKVVNAVYRFASYLLISRGNDFFGPQCAVSEGE